MRDRIEIRLLGPLDARAGDESVPLGGPRQRALLAVLALSAGRAVATSRLIDDLWGEDVPASASKMVQIHVSQLRKVLPPGVLVTRPPGYALAVPPDAVDLHRAERAIGAARAPGEGGDPAAASAALGAALALWRGPALAEFAEPFAPAEAARAEELRLSLTEERIEADLALGRHTSLVGELEALVARHPLRERPLGQLMLALYRCGRQADALAAFGRARRRLDEELGLEPSPALRELERRILRQDAALSAAPAAVATGTPPSPGPGGDRGPPLVGRGPQLERLAILLEEALAGSARLVVVSGEAGIGKSALVEAFLAAADRRPGRMAVASGQCVEQHGVSEPYMPLLEALGRLCGAEGDPSMAGVLRDRAPVWLDQLPGLVADPDRAALDRRVAGATPARMLREGADALSALARRRPLLLVIEDLHWSDPSTVDVLAALARRAEPAPLMVLATLRLDDAATRAHPAHALVRDLGSRGLLAEIPLDPLPPDDLVRYVGARLPGVDLPDRAAAIMLARSRGNPLFLEKVVDGWIESGRVGERGGAWRMEGDAIALAAEVPETLRELIRDRLRQVPGDDRALVESACVAGGEFSAALAAAAAGRPLDEAEERLDRLARAGLILARRGAETWPDGTVASRYGFTHDLCQEVLYDDLAAGRRARLHLRVGRRLEEAYPDRADEVAGELATHFARGGDAARAVGHALAAARRAADRQAPREALESATAGLGLIDEVPPGRERDAVERDLQGVLGLALVTMDGWASEAAERALSRALHLAEAVGDLEQRGRLGLRLASVFEVRGEYERSEELIVASMALGAGAPSAPLRVDSHELLACSLFHQGAFDRALDNAERALEAYDVAYQDPLGAVIGDAPGVASQAWAAHSLWFLGRHEEAEARARHLLDLAARLGTWQARALSHAHVATLACVRPAPTVAAEHAAHTIEAAERGGFTHQLATGLVARGWATAARGAADEGIAELRRGIELARSIGALMDDAFHLGLLADACARAGRTADALAALDEARARVPRGGRFFWDAELRRLRGELLARLGDRAAAVAELGRAIDVARDQGTPTLERRARETLALVGPGAPAGA